MPPTSPYRSEVASRAYYRCEYCRYPEAASSTPLEVDHIIPEAKGGKTELSNLAFCCRSCNLHKFVKTDAHDPVSHATVPLFNPRIQHWDEHFELDRNTGHIIGVTANGRVTVAALALNSDHALAARRLLIQLGLIGRG